MARANHSILCTRLVHFTIGLLIGSFHCMFDAHCDGCKTRVLIGPRRIMRLENRDDGIRLTFRCYCGTVGVEMLGRTSQSEAPPPDPHRSPDTAASEPRSKPAVSRPDTVTTRR